MCLCVRDISTKLVPVWFPGRQPWPTYAPLLPTHLMSFQNQAAEAETIGRNPSSIFTSMFCKLFCSPVALVSVQMLRVSPVFHETQRDWGRRVSRGRGEGLQQSPCSRFSALHQNLQEKKWSLIQIPTEQMTGPFSILDACWQNQQSVNAQSALLIPTDGTFTLALKPPVSSVRGNPYALVLIQCSEGARLWGS